MLSGVFQLGDLLDGSSGGRSDTDHRSVAALEGEHGGVEHAGLARASRSDDDRCLASSDEWFRSSPLRSKRWST